MNDVTTQHPAYRSSSGTWQRMRDVIAGQDAVKARGETYLPRLNGAKPGEYAAYLDRALFYNATARTVQGLQGALFRKSPTVDVPDRVRPDLADATLTDRSITAVAVDLARELLVVGRAGVLIDRPQSPAEGRPYWVTYAAEDIINWRTRTVSGDPQLSLVVLRERVAEPDAGNRFRTAERIRYRVLELTDQGLYQVTLWDQESPRSDFVASDPIIPTRRGQPLPFIPFSFLNVTSLDADPERPPLADLVDVNLSHYRSSADLETGRHFTALPVYYITGQSVDNPVHIGSSVALCLGNADARFGIAEFTGQGLGALETALKEKAAMMATLGARLLESAPVVERDTAVAVQLRHVGEFGSLRTLAQTLSVGLTQCVRRHTWWISSDVARPQDVAARVHVNDDFFERKLSADELRSLVESWQGGAISFDTLYDNLTRGSIARVGISADDEIATIRRTPATNETPA